MTNLPFMHSTAGSNGCKLEGTLEELRAFFAYK